MNGEAFALTTFRFLYGDTEDAFSTNGNDLKSYRSILYGSCPFLSIQKKRCGEEVRGLLLLVLFCLITVLFFHALREYVFVLPLFFFCFLFFFFFMFVLCTFVYQYPPFFLKVT